MSPLPRGLVSFSLAVMTSLVGAVALTQFRGLSELPTLIATSAVIALVPLVVRIKDDFDLFEPIYLFALSFVVLFVVRPAFDVAGHGHLKPWLGHTLDPTYERALLMSIIGALGFYAGYFSRAARELGGRLPVPTERLSSNTLNAYLLFATLFSFAVSLVFLSRVGFGSLPHLLTHRSGSALIQGKSGYLYTAPLWLSALGILVLARATRWQSADGIAAFLLIAFSQVLTLGNGDRSWFLPVVSMVFIVWYLKRGRRPSLLVATLAFVVAFLFGISAARDFRVSSPIQRETLSGAASEPLIHPIGALHQFVDGADTAMVANLAIELQAVPSRIPFKHGMTYVQALARPIPRAVWPHKPAASDTELTAVLFPSVARTGGGFSYSFFGEPYLNFGWMGVLVLSALFGAAWRALYVWFRRAPRNPGVIALFAANWPFLAVYMRGGIGVDYQRQLIVVIPLFLALLLARIPVRRSTVIGAEGTTDVRGVTSPAGYSAKV
jgi:O-antigen polysaccharide polymerase Wzy